MYPKLTEKGNILPVIILLAALVVLFALFKSPLRHKISSLVTQKTTTVTPNYQKPSPSALKTDQTKENTNQKDVTFNKLSFKVPSVYQSGYLGGGTTFAIDPQPIPSTAPYGISHLHFP